MADHDSFFLTASAGRTVASLRFVALQGESAQAARITELEQKAAELGKELATKAAEAKAAVAAMKPMKEQNDQLLGFLTKARAKVDSLKGELEAAQRESEAADAKAKRCDADIERLQAANTQLSEEKQRLQADVDELRAANQRLQQRLQVLITWAGASECRESAYRCCIRTSASRCSKAWRGGSGPI